MKDIQHDFHTLSHAKGSKQTAHPRDFENKQFLQNACLFSSFF